MSEAAEFVGCQPDASAGSDSYHGGASHHRSGRAPYSTKQPPHRVKQKSSEQVSFRLGGNKADPLNLMGADGVPVNSSTTCSPVPPELVVVDPCTVSQKPWSSTDPLGLEHEAAQQKRRNKKQEGKHRHRSQPSGPGVMADEACGPSFEQNGSAVSRGPALKKKYRPKDQLFLYGNYNRYYGYRNPSCSDDDRLLYFHKDWFEERNVLDIGCNVGHVTLWIARNFHPSNITGIDIDPHLIGAARKNIRHYIAPLSSKVAKQKDFPISMPTCLGPLASSLATKTSPHGFPGNVDFKQENFVPRSEESLLTVKPAFDTILALSVTKWFHLNFGDRGLKLSFKKMFRLLRPGGVLILEPQPWKSYAKKKNLSAQINGNYYAIQFRPDMFTQYLLSDEVGFASSETLEPSNKHPGFKRPIVLFRKSAVPNPSDFDLATGHVDTDFPAANLPPSELFRFEALVLPSDLAAGPTVADPAPDAVHIQSANPMET